MLLGITVAGTRSFAAPAAIPGLTADEPGTEIPVEPTATATATPTEIPIEAPTAEAPAACEPKEEAAPAEPTIAATSESATPVAAEEPTEFPAIENCVLPTVEPAPVEPTEATEPDAPPAEPATDPTEVADATDTPTPAGASPDVEDPALVGIPTPVAEDPALVGLPEAAPEDAPNDPSLVGLTPENSAKTDLGDAADPMLSGFVVTVDASASVSEGSDLATVGLTVAVERSGGNEGPGNGGPAIFSSHNKKVSVDLASPDGTVTPGGQISYQFQIMNVGKGRAQFQLEVVINKAGWLVSVSVPPAVIGANGRIQLDADEAMIVTVTVGAPSDAVIGTIAVATLNVIDLR